ncbi:Aste57867_18736 [Aphanomyces stellatus]|uniref:Aste57867_18736 protein n=1 Tax=Aphanomyces stellatus TaxID=120398 RepID=A0A485LCJ9_9STRA|nr:hypothetical protein As57867_018672 [Aphanomyces stellatus]VFT95470.1 Aste57867_18736 [Aphanomyces stellatus]
MSMADLTTMRPQNGTSRWSNNSNVPAVKLRGAEIMHGSEALLFFNTVALMLSASMTLTACCTVFKWSSVRRNPAHGTLFLVFLSLGLWSLSQLAYTFLTHAYAPMVLWRTHNQSFVYITAISDMFFNATSLWCLLATYEFQRFVWQPRLAHPRHSTSPIMVWYVVVVHAIGVAYVVGIFVLERQDAPSAAVGGPRRSNWTHRPVIIFMDASFWVFYAVRWLAVVYPIVLGAVFYPRAAMTQRIRSIVLFVTLLVGLNLPYLVLDLLFTQGVLDQKTDIDLYAMSKLATYFNGVGMVHILSLYMSDFDHLYSPPSPKAEKRRRRAYTESHDAGFLVFHSGSSTPSMIAT